MVGSMSCGSAYVIQPQGGGTVTFRHGGASVGMCSMGVDQCHSRSESMQVSSDQ